MPPMNSLVLLCLFVLASCATSEVGRQILPEQVSWIQRGITNRAEIIQTLGLPTIEIPEFTGLQAESISTTAITQHGDTQRSLTASDTNSGFKPTRAIYIYTRAEAAVFPFFARVKTHQEKFWVRFDEDGIVQDFGFQSERGMTGY